MALDQYLAGASQPSPYTNDPNPNTIVQTSLQAMLDPNSAYIKDARQQGVNYAAERGGLNSSIAAGASQRSAIQAAMPLVNQSLAIQAQRDSLKGQDWIETQGFNRQFQGALTMLPITSSYNMLNSLQQASLQDPALFGPDVISGYSNFFTSNMNDVMGRYFGASGATPALTPNNTTSSPSTTPLGVP